MTFTTPPRARQGLGITRDHLINGSAACLFRTCGGLIGLDKKNLPALPGSQTVRYPRLISLLQGLSTGGPPCSALLNTASLAYRRLNSRAGSRPIFLAFSARGLPSTPFPSRGLFLREAPSASLTHVRDTGRPGRLPRRYRKYLPFIGKQEHQTHTYMFDGLLAPSARAQRSTTMSNRDSDPLNPDQELPFGCQLETILIGEELDGIIDSLVGPPHHQAPRILMTPRRQLVEKVWQTLSLNRIPVRTAPN